MKFVSQRCRKMAVHGHHAKPEARHALKRGGSGALILGLAAAAAVAVPAAASASTHASPVVGHVYVNDNTAGTNTIGAFNRFADGTLAPMHGSQFIAGGAGTGTIRGSQGALQAARDGRCLLAADAGSNQVVVLRIGPDGELSPVGGGPAASGGIKPVSIAVHGNLVYVANAGNGTAGSNYTGFRLNSGGHLTPLSNSTVPLANTANPGDVFFSP